MKKLSDFELPSMPETTHASMRREDKLKHFLSNKLLLSVFAAVVVLVALVSAFTLVDEKLNADATTQSQPETLALQLFADSSAPQELKASFLLAVCSEEERTVKLLACLTADSEKGYFEISYLSAAERCVVGSTEGSIEEHFKRSGSDGLIWAVRACSGRDIDRYIIVDEKDVFSVFNAFGEQTLSIPQEVHHTYNGINFIINEGEQTLSADNISRYFSYLCDNAQSESEGITGLISYYLSLSLENEETQNLTRRFNELVNLIKTDISAMDIATYGSLLASFVE